MHEADMSPASISVVPDGAGWVCTVRWPDGTIVARDIGALVWEPYGVTLSSERNVLDVIAGWVLQHPADWRSEVTT